MITVEITDMKKARACVQWLIRHVGAITSKPYEFVSGPGWKVESRFIPGGDVMVKVTLDLDDESPQAALFVLQFA